MHTTRVVYGLQETELPYSLLYIELPFIINNTVQNKVYMA